MSLFSKHIRESGYLLIEVQSSLVRGTLIRVPPKDAKDQSLHAVFSAVSYVPHHADAEPSYITKKTLSSVKEVVKETLYRIRALRPHNIRFELKDIYFVLSSPWILAQSKVIMKDFERPVEVTREQILAIVEKERSEFAKTADAAVTLIDEKVFDVLLNGYSVADWHGKQTKHLEVRLAASLAGTRMISRFVSACMHAVPAKNVSFHSSLMLQFLAISESRKDPSPALILDIHGELTDVAVMNGHTCVFFGSFPHGVNTMVRAIAHSAHIPEQAADSLINMKEEGKLDPSHAKSAVETLNEIGTGWEHRLHSLLDASPVRGGSLRDVFVLALRHEDYFVERSVHAFPGSRTRTAGDLGLPKLTSEPHTDVAISTRLSISGLGRLGA